MAYSLVDSVSSHLFSFVFRCISMTSLKLKDPASIEAPQASFHQVVIRAQELQNHNLGTNMSHYSSSVNGEGTSHKDPLSRILDELSSLKLWKEKQERKEKGKKRVEEISQDERKKIREEERRKIMKEMKREKHASYSSHNSCKSLSEKLRDYYEERHRSHLRPHSHRREKKIKPQEVNINLPYFHGKDNIEANLVWEIRVEQQLKKKSTSKSYGSHSYPKKDQGQGILGVTPSKPKDDKGKTIEKQAPKASIGHITSQCPTTKTMIMRGQDIYSSQDKATTSPSSNESEKAKGEESSEEIYPQEEGQTLVVKEKCKEVSVSSKRLAKKETHFTIKTNIKETFPLRQPPHFLFCKKTLANLPHLLGLIKKLLDEGLVHKSLNPCALLVPKIGIIRHQVPKIGGMMNVLSGATLFCKITRAPNIFMVCVHRDPLGRFVLIFSFNTNLGTHMGHLSNQGVPMNPKRIKVIPEWPTPPSIRKILGFYDLTNFYKRFVPYFSILVAPLIELVRNHVPSWEDAQEMGQILSKVEGIMQSYPARALDRRLQVDWARDPREGPRAHLGGEAPSSMAYSLVDGVSSHLFSFVFRCISMVENYH
ncbi:putative mitochondrial protein [Glycine soja]